MKCKIKKNCYHNYTDEYGGEYAHGHFKNTDYSGEIMDTNDTHYLIRINDTASSGGYKHISPNIVLWYLKEDIELLETQNEIILW